MTSNQFMVKTQAPLPVALNDGQNLRLVLFGGLGDDVEVAALVHRAPEVRTTTALVRIHSACMTGDVFGSLRCDCGAQLEVALREIGRAPFGVLLYFIKHEGRGIGLLNKLRAYALQDAGMDTVEANLALGLPADGRDFGPAVAILEELGVQRVRLMTNNPEKVAVFQGSDLRLEEIVPLEVPPSRFSERYLDTKRRRMGHMWWNGSEPPVPPTLQEPPDAGCDANYGASSAVFSRHRGPITSVATVPNSDLVVSAGYDCAVGLFDAARLRVSLLGYHDHLVNHVVADDRGRLAASCSSDYSVRIWDIHSRREVRTLLGHSDDVESFVFIGDWMGASASRDRRILVWDLRTGVILRVLEGHEQDVLWLAYENGALLSSGADKTLRVWDAETGRLRQTLGPFELESDACAIDSVHGRLVLGDRDGTLSVFDIVDGRLVREFKAHDCAIERVAVARGSGDLLSAAYDQRVRIWRGDDLAWEYDIQSPPPWERSLTWSHDGARILGGTFDGTVKGWESKTGRLLFEIGAAEEEDDAGNPCFNDLTVSPRGQAVLAGDDGRLRTADLTAQRMHWTGSFTPRGGRRLMNAVAIDPSGRWIASGAHDHRLHVWRVSGSRLEEHRELRLEEGPIDTIRIRRGADDSAEIFAGCHSGAIVRLCMDGTILQRFRPGEGAVKALRLHREAPLGVSCSAGGALVSWNFDGNVVRCFTSHGAILNDVDLDPSMSRVASVGRDFCLSVYELDTGTLVERIDLGRRSLKCLCFFGEETILVGDYWGHLIRVDLAGLHVHRRRIADNGISALERAGDLVVACSYDGGFYRVDPGTLEPTDTLKAMQQRLATFQIKDPPIDTAA